MTRSKLSYSLIKDSQRGSYKIYICPASSKTISIDSLYDKEFVKLKNEMQKYGFSHITLTTFRSKPNSTIKSIEEFFKKFKIKRNKDVEKSMLEHIKLNSSTNNTPLIISSNRTQTSASTFSDDVDLTSSLFNIPDDNILDKYIISDPHIDSSLAIKHNDQEEVDKISQIFKIGDTINLSLYMFLTIKQVNGSDVSFDLDFDFKSPIGNETRRFIQHIDLEFINNGFDDNRRINLQSTKTYKDILKDVHYLYAISVMNSEDLLSGKKLQPNMYNAVELRHYIDLNRAVHLSFSSNDFINVLAMSGRIKNEKQHYDLNTTIPLVIIKGVSESILNRLNNRMLDLSAAEEYEAAVEYKKSKDYIQKKIELIDQMQNDGVVVVTCDVIDDKFSMRDFDF